MIQQKKRSSLDNSPIKKSMPIFIEGVDRNGIHYKAEDVYKLLSELNESKVFNKLSVSVTISRALISSRTGEGFATVARVTGYDADKHEIKVIFYGKNVEYAYLGDNMSISPMVRLNKGNHKPEMIIGFQIVNPQV